MVTLPHDNPFESSVAQPSRVEQGESPKTIFPYAVGVVVLGNLGLCLLSPGLGIVVMGLVSAPGLFNGYASLKRKMRYETADSEEQWYCIFFGFAQLLPLGLLSMVFGGMIAFLIDATSTEDTSIDEALSGIIVALLIYIGGVIAMHRWNSRN